MISPTRWWCTIRRELVINFECCALEGSLWDHPLWVHIFVLWGTDRPRRGGLILFNSRGGRDIVAVNCCAACRGDETATGCLARDHLLPCHCAGIFQPFGLRPGVLRFFFAPLQFTPLEWMRLVLRGAIHSGKHRAEVVFRQK